jgi:uncharacterized protein
LAAILQPVQVRNSQPMIEASSALFAKLLTLNNDHATQLSYADTDRFAALMRIAYFVEAMPDGSAFLLAFDQDSDYDSENFLWFRARYTRFIYIDRVVVEQAARGQGLAKKLYADLFNVARVDGHSRIVCEVNSDPPNPASDAFHASLNFSEVGAQTLSTADKSVRYLLKNL